MWVLNEAAISLIDFFGFDDARLHPLDWSLRENPFWTSYALTIVIFPCLFYLTWFFNPSLSNNRLGLSWVLGFFSASMFTLAGFYEVPHLRTTFNAAVDYQPATSTSFKSFSSLSYSTSLSTALSHYPVSDAKAMCYPILKAGTLALAAASLPSFLKITDTAATSPSGTSPSLSDSNHHIPKYYCFSDLDTSTAMSFRHGNPLLEPVLTFFSSPLQHLQNKTQGRRKQEESLRHLVYQAQMERPHLAFSLENYPDDGRLGPHLVAGNFQAFLVVDLVLGLMHYRKQLEIFSTVIHHIIYYFIVIHMRAGDMLSVFCICGTPIEASSIFLSYGRMFPARRTKIVEMLYVICFVSTRLIYVSLLWHEVYFNYPDKSVSFLYTITLSLHVYWFVLYLKTQKRFKARQRRQHLCAVLESLASSVREEISVLETSRLAIKENLCFTNSTRTTYTTTTYVRRKLESSELDFSPVHSPTVMAKSVSAGPSHLLDWRKLQQLQQPKKDLLLDETGLPFDEHENMGSIDEQVASRGNQYGDVLLPLLSRNVSSGRGRSSQSEIYVNQI